MRPTLLDDHVTVVSAMVSRDLVEKVFSEKRYTRIDVMNYKVKSKV